MSKGYKVVCYSEWQSLPDIFGTLREAQDAKKKWHLGEKSVIESFNSKSSRAKVIKERE